MRNNLKWFDIFVKKLIMNFIYYIIIGLVYMSTWNKIKDFFKEDNDEYLNRSKK